MTVQQALARLLDGHGLTRDEAREVMNEIMEGEATPAATTRSRRRGCRTSSSRPHTRTTAR